MASFSGTPDKSLSWNRAKLDGLNLQNKKAIIIGGTGGLGRAIAQVLASRGASVTVVGQTFRDQGSKIQFVKADLSLMKEAARIGAEIPVDGVDLVVLTTGIFAAPKREETTEGLERDMAVSYLSRLAILRELAPRLASRTRVFVMGFPGTGQKGQLGDLNAEATYKPMDVHMNTVAGNEMLVLDAARRYPNLSFFGLNPGLIKTNIRDNFLGSGLKSRLIEGLIGLLMISPEKYAERLVPLLVAPELEGRSGAMFNQKGVAILPTKELTPEHTSAFIAASETLVQRALSRK